MFRLETVSAPGLVRFSSNHSGGPDIELSEEHQTELLGKGLNMLKKTGLAVVALLVVLILISPPQANAAVRFGLSVGPTYAYPVVPYTYGYPYGYAPYYGNPYAYGYPAAPGYVYPYGGFGYYWGGHYDHYYGGFHDGWNRGGNWGHPGFHGDSHRR